MTIEANCRALALGIVTALALSIDLAIASEPEVMQPEAAETTDPGKHCAALIEPAGKGGRASAVRNLGCFATFAEAVSAGTGGEVALSDALTPETLQETDVEARAVRLIGIDYDGRFFSGRSFSWFANNAFGCLGGRTYRATYLGLAFDNKLTSTRGFGNCGRNDSFTGYFQNGIFGRCFPNCTFIGTLLNNTTSSKRWLR